MSDSEARQKTETIQENGKMLKYLDFVQVAAIYAMVCFSNHLRVRQTELRSTQTWRRNRRSHRQNRHRSCLRQVPRRSFRTLKFVDRKVDESLPSLVKLASSQARAVASEVQRAGVVDTAKSITSSLYSKYEPTAKELYWRYEPVAEQYAVSAWQSLNRLPIFPQSGSDRGPHGRLLGREIQSGGCYTNERGYVVAEYLR
ncbi:hypothetical protein EZV62_010446 [Acer yangbiense]|uniref:Uncharacterized protein n=1 Tax=Acer yangbiense TaxID=1000413 RepID=A0A5C7I4Q4_9ROSI|nr:hypothetical protein EZV62_010446 [Acer yangbiense]